jgi:hypothetical protein
MTSDDCGVIGVQKVIDNGPASKRFNLVILGDGYLRSELPSFAAHVAKFIEAFKAAAPFDSLWPAINIYRVDVVSTDSGALDPLTCGDQSVGSGRQTRTYFDSTFCGDGQIRRLLTCNSQAVLSAAQAAVPEAHMTMLIVNTEEYGGSGGQVATVSAHPSSVEIALHEMGHTAFGFADEYEYYAGCDRADAGHDRAGQPEPVEPNITVDTTLEQIKWKDVLSNRLDPLPTTSNPDCSRCDPQPNPQSDDYVGAFEGAGYFHCGLYRGSYNCRMRQLGHPFCMVCQQAIRQSFSPFLLP